MKIALFLENDSRFRGHSGIPVYLRNLVSGLSKAGCKVILVYRNLPREPLFPGVEERAYGIGKLPLFWSQKLRSILIRNCVKDCDIVHCPTSLSVPYYRVGRPLVVTLHGGGAIRHPEWSLPHLTKAERKFCKLSLRFVDQVICVSHFVKDEFLDFCDFPADRVDVVYQSIDLNTFKPTVGDVSPLVKMPYLLFVSATSPRKNLHGLFEGFKYIFEKIPHYLVVVGDRAWGENPQVLARRYGVESRVIFLGGMPHAMLRELYSQAEAYVFPSLNEGFGYTPLEAMACGCPVITSNTTSLVELYSSASLLVDPCDPKDIAEKIMEVICNPNIREHLVVSGKALSEQFSLERTIEGTLSTYSKAIHIPYNLD